MGFNDILKYDCILARVVKGVDLRSTGLNTAQVRILQDALKYDFVVR